MPISNFLDVYPKVTGSWHEFLFFLFVYCISFFLFFPLISYNFSFLIYFKHLWWMSGGGWQQSGVHWRCSKSSKWFWWSNIFLVSSQSSSIFIHHWLQWCHFSMTFLVQKVCLTKTFPTLDHSVLGEIRDGWLFIE